jgi:tetrapyrrole methylase family protein/MazG family protein/ATP diphosphatase
MGEPEHDPRPPEEPAPTGEPRTDGLRRLLAVVDRLRAPDGCPWDLEQTVASLAPSLVEEAFEAVEAIEAGDDEAVREELGDLLMALLLICKVAEQEGRFDAGDAARAVAEKLVRRHPHVFGSESVDGAAHVIENWERIKEAERAAKRADTSALAGVPRALPALQRANRLGAKAIAAGFRWSDADGALAKLEEEVREVRDALRSEDPAALERELGDVLLAAALLGNYAEVDAERALRGAVRRFEARFRHMEAELGGSVRETGLTRLLEAWRRAKGAESDGAGARPGAR